MPLSAAPPTPPPPPPPGFVAHKKSPWTVPFAQAPEGTKSHHVAAVKLALQDINARRNEYWFPVPSGLTCLLEEERDLPMLATFSNITLLVGGSAVALFTFSEPVRPHPAHLAAPPLPAALKVFSQGTAAAHFFGVLYVVWAWVFWGARFILGLHYAEHRRLFCTPTTHRRSPAA